jgi:hypothetical protein
VIGGVLGSAEKENQHDYAWFTPAPPIVANTQVAVPIVSGGSLILVNSEDTLAEVDIVSANMNANPQKVTVPAGAAVVAPAPADALITSSQPITAGVRYLSGGNIAGYPIQSADTRTGELTVFTR